RQLRSSLPRQLPSLPLRSGGRWVGRPGRGQAFDFDPDASSKIKSAPFTPFGGASPASQGKRQHVFQTRRDNCRPFPCAAGEGGSADPEGGRLLTLILMLQARSRAPPSPPSG